MMSARHRLSIRAQLLLLVLSVALPAAAIVAYYVVHDAQEARDDARARVRILAVNTQSILEQMLSEQEAVLSRVAARPRVRALDPRNCDPIIREYVRPHPGFTTLAVRDAHGKLVCSSDPNPPTQAQMVGFAWFHEGLRSGRFTASNVYPGPSSGRWVSVLTYPIRDDQSRVSGLILLGVDLLQLNERLLRRSPKNAVQIVLDRNDNFLLRSLDPALWIGKPLAGPQADAIRGRHTGAFSTLGSDGVQRLYAVETVPGAGWRVFAGLPESEVFADYHERLARVAVIGFALLALVLALAWRIGMAIARPIRDLADTAGRIAGGDSAARVRIAGPAEIEFVGQEFNRMLDAQGRQREERAALVGHFEHLVRLARDIFLLIDPSGNIVEANEAAVAAYGYSADALRGMNIRALRTAQSLATLEQDWQASTQPGGALFETVHRRRDGSTFPVEVSSRTIDIEGRLYRQSFIRDISERRAAEAQIRRLNSAYATLSETNEAIVRLHDANELFPRICRIAVEFGGCIGASVGLVDEQNRRIVPVAIDGSIDAYVRQIVVSTDPARPEGRGPAALALREGRPYYCRDFMEDPATEPWHALAAEFGVRSLAALPLRRAGNVIGTLTLYSAEAGAYDAPMRALLEEMAADISFALDNFERDAARRQAEAALAQSEARFRDIIETTHDGFILVGGRGELLDTNKATSELSGYSREQLLKMTLRDLEAVETDEEIARTTAEVVAAGHGRFERTWRCVDGRLLNVEVSTTYMGKASGGYFFAFIRNITGRKQVEQSLRESEERFRAMLEQNISAMFVVEEGMLSYVNRRAAEIFGYSADELIGRALVDLIREDDRPAVSDAMRQMLRGEQKSIERNFGALRKDGTVADIGAHAIVATLQGKKAILGMAEDIGERKKAQSEIERYIGRLERAMQSTLTAVSLMVELRDPYTAGHEHRVGELAAAIGAELGLPDDTVQGLRLAGYVHDIGKISVPAEMLSKPSRLTPMEFELIKCHSQSGHDVLRGVDFPWPLAEVILQHHERLDGSGYPRKLKGGEIILEARIMAVADVVEAMSSHRPYRAGLGLDAALEEITRNSGKLYDAQAAAACLRLFRDKGYVLPA